MIVVSCGVSSGWSGYVLSMQSGRAEYISTGMLIWKEWKRIEKVCFDVLMQDRTMRVGSHWIVEKKTSFPAVHYFTRFCLEICYSSYLHVPVRWALYGVRLRDLWCWKEASLIEWSHCQHLSAREQQFDQVRLLRVSGRRGEQLIRVTRSNN